jgi:hypothetical protein
MSEKIKIFENPKAKAFRSENYNFNFNKQSGLFMRWGKTEDDDPIVGLPEILDIEVSEICHGVNNVPCPFCYKSNVGFKGRNMSLETFKKVIDNFFFLKNIEIELENGQKLIVQSSYKIRTNRGNILAKDLKDTDEIILE